MRLNVRATIISRAAYLCWARRRHLSECDIHLHMDYIHAYIHTYVNASIWNVNVAINFNFHILFNLLLFLFLACRAISCANRRQRLRRRRHRQRRWKLLRFHSHSSMQFVVDYDACVCVFVCYTLVVEVVVVVVSTAAVVGSAVCRQRLNRWGDVHVMVCIPKTHRHTHTHKHTLTVARHEQGNKYSDLLLPLLLFKSKWTIKSEQAWPEWPGQARPSLELKPGPVCG